MALGPNHFVDLVATREEDRARDQRAKASVVEKTADRYLKKQNKFFDDGFIRVPVYVPPEVRTMVEYRYEAEGWYNVSFSDPSEPAETSWMRLETRSYASLGSNNKP